MFSPQAKSKKALTDEALSSSAFGQRLREHLERAGLAGGETVHGLRRGRTQALSASGLSAEAVMEVMGMKSKATFQLYNDPTRPVRGG